MYIRSYSYVAKDCYVASELLQHACMHVLHLFKVAIPLNRKPHSCNHHTVLDFSVGSL